MNFIGGKKRLDNLKEALGKLLSLTRFPYCYCTVVNLIESKSVNNMILFFIWHYHTGVLSQMGKAAG